MNSRVCSLRRSWLKTFLCVLSVITNAEAQDPTATVVSLSEPPSLFIVGDSIVQTGRDNGETGPWGWGSELIPLFDNTKIQVHNEGRGGRSSRGYFEEGLWSNVLERLKPGDFVLLHFGHNDARNSQNYPDRTTITGNGDQTVELGVRATRKTLHTYGWYLRQYVGDSRANGATPIICSPAPRNTWIDGKIKRGLDGYAEWAADAADSSRAHFVDLNTLAANRFDAMGPEEAAGYFSDKQHTTKAGARLNAECVVEGVKQLNDCPLVNYLSPTAVQDE